MRIYPTTQLMAQFTIAATVDLATATGRVQIEDVWYPLDWVTASTQIGDLPSEGYKRTGQIEVGGVLSSADAIFLSSQQPLVEVTVNGESIVKPAGRVGVYS